MIRSAIVSSALGIALAMGACDVTTTPTPTPDPPRPHDAGAAADADDDASTEPPLEDTPVAPQADPPPPVPPPPPPPPVSDAGPTIVDGGADDAPKCGLFDDRHFGFRNVSFPASDADLSYDPGCMVIGPGQTVTFRGDFASYPLVPFGDGTTNPIPVTVTGKKIVVAFPKAGRFRYGSPSFASMRGAIEVR